LRAAGAAGIGRRAKCVRLQGTRPGGRPWCRPLPHDELGLAGLSESVVKKAGSLGIRVTIVVTGVSSCIGRAMGELLTAKGFDVVLVARRGDRLVKALV
jgi:hypothetical protein